MSGTPKQHGKERSRVAGSGAKKGKRKYLRGDALDAALGHINRLLNDPRVPDGRLSSAQAHRWFQAQEDMYKKVEYRTFRQLLTLRASGPSHSQIDGLAASGLKAKLSSLNGV